MAEFDSVLMGKYLVAYAKNKGYGCSFSITKLQKLLYIVYGTFLVSFEKRLIKEHPQAWPYGPVFPRASKHIKIEEFSSLSITQEMFSEIRNSGEEDSINRIIDSVLTTFGGWTAAQLSKWSHSEYGPWDIVVKGANFKWGNEIPDILISQYFKSILA